MEEWRKCWREGFAPGLSTAALEALQKALETDDPRLLQGATTTPPPLHCTADWPVEAACVIGYAGWQGEDLDTVAEVESFFASECFDCDNRLAEPAGCRWMLNWYDETPREEMIRALLPEVKRSIALRNCEKR